MEHDVQNTSSMRTESTNQKPFDPKVLELLIGTEGAVPGYCHCGAMKRTK